MGIGGVAPLPPSWDGLGSQQHWGTSGTRLHGRQPHACGTQVVSDQGRGPHTHWAPLTARGSCWGQMDGRGSPSTKGTTRTSHLSS